MDNKLGTLVFGLYFDLKKTYKYCNSVWYCFSLITILLFKLHTEPGAGRKVCVGGGEWWWCINTNLVFYVGPNIFLKV